MLFSRKDPIVDALLDAGVGRRDARRLALAGTPINVPAGVPLCTEGEFGKQAFMLVSGEATVRLVDGDRVLQPGEVFGEIATLNAQIRRTATVETTEDSLVLVFDPRTFMALAVDMRELLAPRRAA